LDRREKLHGTNAKKPPGPPAPSQPHKIILEGSLTNPRGELVDDPLQVSLANFWKVSQDEMVERRQRLELLEQRLASLKLSVTSDAEYAPLECFPLSPSSYAFETPYQS
jgi:hypothetical protein